ncbi:DUF7281 domain-containing protein [Ferrimonas futtsuensis]|uniref:DUF7281 domain-containing protein n=1 Tax=Ferrimonas futtsuensis TaxID=364764 RepID=UPI0003FD2698|nr:hypothetical protein [Ferrimonas futtsuensis]
MSDSRPDRITQAGRFNDEKRGSAPVKADMVLVNALGSLQLNGERYPVLPFAGAGSLIDQRFIDSVEHPALVLVENLSVMTALPRLLLPEPLSDALFLYRGDMKDTSNSAASKAFARLSCPLKVVFADFDPKGVEIALTCGAEQALLPEQQQWPLICDAGWRSLEGPEQRWQNQRDARVGLGERAAKPEWVDTALSTMGRFGQTRTQEHLIAHQVPLALFPLS